MEYVKETQIVDKTKSQKESQLLNSILSAKEELKKAHLNYEYAENDLIDFYTYQILALQSKLDHLTKLAKKTNLTV